MSVVTTRSTHDLKAIHAISHHNWHSEDQGDSPVMAVEIDTRATKSMAQRGRHSVSLLIAVMSCLLVCDAQAEDFRISTFSADVTIPLNHRCMGVLPTKSKVVSDPLEARGVVLTGSERPIVICAVDWCEIRNGAYDQWREALANAVGTNRERVLVTSLHQHDAPVTDSGAAEILRSVGLAGELYDEEFHTKVVERVAAAAKLSLSESKPINAVGTGMARVENIASNRRVVDADGRVSFGRGSSSGGNEFHREFPDGEIDPMLRMLSFWNDDQPVAALSVYATHPMSYYGRGEVSADFVGLARRKMQRDVPEVFQIYASGCSGDVTAGKYNDGSEKAREGLINRLHAAIAKAWKNTERTPLSEVHFRSESLNLEFFEHQDLNPEKLQRTIEDDSIRTESRILAAMGLSSWNRVQKKQAIDFPCVSFGKSKLLLFPGEAFVGYQLMAQDMADDSFVVSMGYGECWPGYIPMNASFADHFQDKWLWVPPGSENRIQAVLSKLLTP